MWAAPAQRDTQVLGLGGISRNGCKKCAESARRPGRDNSRAMDMPPLENPDKEVLIT
jgi:hypothetical protein